MDDGTVYCNLLYSGNEGARLILTRLYLATGERFFLHDEGDDTSTLTFPPRD
jgi:hypothetical protein